MRVRIDHVIYAVRDLDVAAGKFRDLYGLDSYPGGTHPAYGTGNRIVPFGDSYLELMTVADTGLARTNPLGQHVGAFLARGEGFLGWIVATDDIEADAARLDLTIVPGERTQPDGTTVRWRAAGIEMIVLEPSLPFFIAWDDMDLHPSRTPVEHASAPSGFAWVEIAGDPSRLKGWLGDHTLPVRVLGGPGNVLAVGITTADGELVLS